MYGLKDILLGCQVCNDFHIISEDNLDCFQVNEFTHLENCMETDNNPKPEDNAYVHRPQCQRCLPTFALIMENGTYRCINNNIPNCLVPINDVNLTNSPSCKTCITNHYRSLDFKTCHLGLIPTCLVL